MPFYGLPYFSSQVPGKDISGQCEYTIEHEEIASTVKLKSGGFTSFGGYMRGADHSAPTGGPEDRSLLVRSCWEELLQAHSEHHIARDSDFAGHECVHWIQCACNDREPILV